MPVLPLVNCQVNECRPILRLCILFVRSSLLYRHIRFSSKNSLSLWPQACAIETTFGIHSGFPAAQFIWFRFERCNLLRRCRKLNRKLWQALKTSFILDNFARAISTYLIYLFQLLWLFVAWMSSEWQWYWRRCHRSFHKSQCYRKVKLFNVNVNFYLLCPTRLALVKRWEEKWKWNFGDRRSANESAQNRHNEHHFDGPRAL